MAKRIKYIDIAKGLMIIMLLIHHFGSGVIRLGENQLESWAGMLNFQRVYLPFFMQSFFILSGYCSNFQKSRKSFYVSLMKQILLPLFVFEFIRKFFDSIIYNDISIIVRYYTTMDFFTTTTLWFLYALFISKLIIFMFSRISIPSKWQLVLLFIFLLLGIILNQNNIGPNFFYYKQALGSAFFVGIGNFFKESPKRMQLLMDKSLYIYPWLLIFTTIYPIGLPVFTAAMAVQIWQVPIFVFSASCGSLWLIKICQLIGHSRFLEYWGENTLVVYGMHFILLQIIMRVIYNIMAPSGTIQTIVYMCMVYALLIPLCMLSIWFFNTKKLRWTLGKF